jgi:Ribbon-helix-helix domain
MCVLAGYANFTRWLVVTWLRKTAQLGGALPGYTGFRDDRIDSLGQPGLAGAGASARPPVANGRAKLVLMPSHVQPRRIIINGHPTSVRLEPAFWG